MDRRTMTTAAAPIDGGLARERGFGLASNPHRPGSAPAKDWADDWAFATRRCPAKRTAPLAA